MIVAWPILPVSTHLFSFMFDLCSHKAAKEYVVSKPNLGHALANLQELRSRGVNRPSLTSRINDNNDNDDNNGNHNNSNNNNNNNNNNKNDAHNSHNDNNDDNDNKDIIMIFIDI